MDAPERIEVNGVEYVRAYPVAKGRCPHCGLVPRRWTAGAVLRSLRAYADRFGHPPTSNDLQAPPSGFPFTRTTVQIFGSWEAALRAADLPAFRYPPIWTDERIIEALLDWAAAHGGAPTAKDWLYSAREHPTAALVARRFGSWNTAIRKAGFRARGASGSFVDPPHKTREVLIDATPIAEALRDRESLSGLAELSGVEVSHLQNIRAGRTRRIRESYADRIAIALDRPDILDAQLVAA